MPIIERDPWRMQYFESVSCPAHVMIPTDDPDSYQLYPKHRWIYNKLLVAETQGLRNGPHGVEPPFFPVFSKPICNLKGMGVDSRLIRNANEYQRVQRPGHMWMEALEGDHFSSDVALVDGEPCWWRHVHGEARDRGTFDYWTILGAPRPELEGACGAWLRTYLAGYTGMANLETIGGKIIEVHLRFSDQWPDLYGELWLDALVRLHVDGVWRFDDRGRRDGYSVVAFADHGAHYRHPPRALVEELSKRAGVSSIQITFHEDRAPDAHAMPPGGFRLAIVNCWDLDVGRVVRERLRRAIVTAAR
jgi:hypothetical protein